MLGNLKPLLCAAAMVVLAGCVPQASQGSDADRFLVYFDEFSANLTPEAQRVVADAAKAFQNLHAHSMRIEGRASATGSPAANQYLAATRSQVVADELAKDGLDRAAFRQVWIGQTGSGDPGVAERRVDIVVER